MVHADSFRLGFICLDRMALNEPPLGRATWAPPTARHRQSQYAQSYEVYVLRDEACRAICTFAQHLHDKVQQSVVECLYAYLRFVHPGDGMPGLFSCTW